MNANEPILETNIYDQAAGLEIYHHRRPLTFLAGSSVYRGPLFLMNYKNEVPVQELNTSFGEILLDKRIFY